MSNCPSVSCGQWRMGVIITCTSRSNYPIFKSLAIYSQLEEFLN